MRAAVVSAWSNVGTPERPRYRPSVVDAYHIADWEDITGQPAEAIPPDPNALVVEVECDADTLAQMDAGGVAILWAEEVEDGSGGS